ncbi:MAG: hypothetical protein HS124_09165 [Anaerolineales bacterium]|nr:hypothetical protein [Anaerolineales bacterium]
MRNAVRAWVLTVCAIVAFAFWHAQPVKAQEKILLENVGAVYRFGEQIVFSATVRTSFPIQAASITLFDENYNQMRVQPLTLDARQTLQFILDARQNAPRPFTFIRWRYDFNFADGTAFQSEVYSVRYDDNRFAWQRLESNGLRVFWFQGDATFAQNALNVALAGVRAINEIFLVDLNQPIDIFIYPLQTDLAFLSVDAQAVGHANVGLGVVLVAVEPGFEQSLQMDQRIPHELMHVLSYRALGAGYKNLPAWLREGLAAVVEINPSVEYNRVLQDARARRAIIPLKDLCASFPPQPDSTFLAYAEARSFTAYLRDAFGVSKLIELSRSYADGVTCERGVEITYDASLAQLELNWRESIVGENVWALTLQNLLPYLVLCGLVLGIPLLIGFNAMRKKRIT